MFRWYLNKAIRRGRMVLIESNGRITDEEAYALVTGNLVDLLGIRGIGDDMSDLVAFEGGSMFDLISKPIAVISSVRESVDFF